MAKVESRRSSKAGGESVVGLARLASLVAGHFCKRLVKLVRDRLELLLLVHQLICKARMSFRDGAAAAEGFYMI